jgi:hypothetical protein
MFTIEECARSFVRSALLAALFRRAVATTILTVSTALSGPVLADPITFNFGGTVTQTSFDPYDPLAGAVVAGSPFYSYLNFDTNAVDTAPSPILGSYTLSGFPFGFASVVGSVLFPVMSTVNISIADGVGGAPDQYSVFASEGTVGGLDEFFSISILLQDESGFAFSSDALPSTVPDLNHFSIRTFDLAGQYTDLNGTFIQYEIQGNLLPVSEPGAAELACVALLGCMLASRRFRSAVRADPLSGASYVLL